MASAIAGPARGASAINDEIHHKFWSWIGRSANCEVRGEMAHEEYMKMIAQKLNAEQWKEVHRSRMISSPYAGTKKDVCEMVWEKFQGELAS